MHQNPPPPGHDIPVGHPPQHQPIPIGAPPQYQYGYNPRRVIEVSNQRFLMFGIPYGIVVILLNLLLFAGAILSIMTTSSVSDPDLADLILKASVAVLVISGLGLAYSSLTTFMCIRGSTVGLVMGIVHTGLMLLMFIINMIRAAEEDYMSNDEFVAVSLGTLILAALFTVGLLQFLRRERGHGDPHQVFDGPLLRPQPGGMYAPAATPAPAPVAKAAPVSEPDAKPKPAFTGAQQAFIELLGIAASIDDNRTEARLKRARQAANKVLGPDHKTAVMSLLNDPTLIGDLHDDVKVVAKKVREDDRLRAIALKAAAAVLREDDKLDPQATDLLQHLKLALA
jgi:hypothetical protein